MMDAAAKGRVATRPKLTWGQVDAIRASRQRGIDLARQFGVSPGLISMIIRRERWTRPAVQEP